MNTIREPDRHIYLCCIAKNEDHYIQEWIDYHFKLGFERIVIFANNWDYKNDDERIKVIPTPGGNKQSESYNNFLRQYRKKFWWVAFFDVDEFLVLHKHKNIEELLLEYDDVQAIAFNWLMFGSNGHKKVVNNNYNVLSRFTKRASVEGQTKYGNFLIKIMMRYTNKGDINIHNCTGITHTLSRKEIDSTLLKKPINPRNKPIEVDIAQLNHYWIKSDEEAINIKIARGRATGAPKKTIEALKKEDAYANEVEDLAAYNFFHGIKK
jgi:hypothetical protein